MFGFLMKRLRPYVTPTIFVIIKDAILIAAVKAKETKTPYDDMFVEALASLLGIKTSDVLSPKPDELK